MIRQFWLSYCNTSSSQASQLSERTNSACGGMVERKMPQTVNCVDHIKTALYMHVRKLTDFLNLLPMTGGMFSEEKKQMIVMKSWNFKPNNEMFFFKKYSLIFGLYKVNLNIQHV